MEIDGPSTSKRKLDFDDAEPGPSWKKTKAEEDQFSIASMFQQFGITASQPDKEILEKKDSGLSSGSENDLVSSWKSIC